MITTGVITEINISSQNHVANKYKVAMNIFKTPLEKEDFECEANCAILGGFYSAYNVGDKVYIGFLNNDYSFPVIIGKIYQGVKEEENRGFGHLNTLTVQNSAVFPLNTKIGDISGEILSNNIKKINNLETKLNIIDKPVITINQETEIGIFENKKLFRKIIKYSGAITRNTATTIGNLGTSVDSVLKISQAIRNSSNAWWSNDYLASTENKGVFIQIEKATGNVKLTSINEDWTAAIIYVTVEYTKA